MLYLRILLVFSFLAADGASADNGQPIRTFRQLFSRFKGRRLSGLPAKQIPDRRVEECAEACVKESEFACQSFDFDNELVTCRLYSVDLADSDVALIDAPRIDHYGSAYTKLFKKLPSHQLFTWVNRRLEGVTVEQCARRCILETSYKCRGFNYNRVNRVCQLTEATASNSHGATEQQDFDYYQREDRGPLHDFINYGHRAMRSFVRGEVYQKSLLGISLQDCASRCLAETTFVCLSFDYIYMGEKSTCHMSKYIAANVMGLVIEDPSVRVNHFEKIEKYLHYYYSTPYSVILGNNLKTFEHVTPNRCARMCMEEEGFICRSFDYQVEQGTCLLSTKTGSDVGGLYSPGLLQEVHHFEMKPIFDCGGNLTEDQGNIASPGWPRNYVHHEYCTWTIRVQKFKVIHIRFTHFGLGLQSMDPCNQRDDRLTVSEPNVKTPYCVMPNTHEISSQGNEMTLTFVTNSEMDGTGFRAFYTAEWTCDAFFDSAPGQFASPHWPAPYPSAQRCMWRLKAPEEHQVRVTFTSFKLEEHPLGHCNADGDHVIVRDGGTVKADKIGMYCNTQYHLSLRSTGREMLVQFFSDEDKGMEGFHASFVFEPVLEGGLLLPGEGTDHIVDLDQDPSSSTTALPKSTAADTEEKTNEIDEEINGEKELTSDELLDSWGLPRSAAAAVGNDVIDGETHRQYKRGMWAVVTVLVIVILALFISIFLLWRHYRRKLDNQGELVKEEAGMELLPHPVPAPRPRPRPTISPPLPKPNNGEMAGETVAMCTTSCAEAMAKEEALQEEDTADTASGGACADQNNYVDCPKQYGKYSKENVKNINLDTKNKLSEFE